MSSDRRGKDIVLDYNGVRAVYHVPAAYPELNLPMKYLGNYLNDQDLGDPASDKYARFIPTGKTELRGSEHLQIWAFDREIDA